MYHMLHQLTAKSFRALVESMAMHHKIAPTMEELQENQRLDEQIEVPRPESIPAVLQYKLTQMKRVFI